MSGEWVAPVALKVGKTMVKAGTWLMTVRIVDDKLWRKIKSGEITGFSIGGVASVV